MRSSLAARLIARFEAKSSTIGVLGLGYVGLPICLAAAEAGIRVLGFDTDKAKPAMINERRSYFKHIDARRIGRQIDSGMLFATSDFSRLGEPDALLICVPTPLTAHLEPDLSFVESTGRQIAKHLRRGQLVVLESTTYPGTTRQVLQPILEMSGLICNEDFFLAFSPEREDPGNSEYSTAKIPRIIGADRDEASEVAMALYKAFV
ncbi:MAG TPA: NAD(P)-binding domain-containing protein, partial [Hyphomicrobiales bacterium]|nr:NAD(P)-binding domain-containing protein [Hyphomicrobiales bacterium]